jgi:excisionase family DNA binding protein
MAEHDKQAAELPGYITRREVAERLRTTEGRVLELSRRSDDPLPFKRPGRKYLYDWSEVEAWVERETARVEREDRHRYNDSLERARRARA